MALYAFDGTWQDDDQERTKLTNIVHFTEAYPEELETVYVEGVGTRGGLFGKIIGGTMGVGGRSRVDDMLDRFREIRRKDRFVDIVGFSRGSALAVHFANKVADEFGQEVEIRFLGLFDTVGSFGIPINVGTRSADFQATNIGWDIETIPQNVAYAVHAMALDERRRSFNLTRPSVVDPGKTELVESWFRGVHSDVGGGNGNVGRNSISLAWMIEHAKRAGVPMNDDVLSRVQLQIDVDARVSKNTDPRVDPVSPERTPSSTDTHHPSAIAKALAVGETHTFEVAAASKMNPTGLQVREGESYSFSVDEDQTWIDDTIECGPQGWESDSTVMRVGEHFRRVPEANWFELIGVVGADDNDRDRVRIGGRTSPIAMPQNGQLYCYANDVEMYFYRNNRGALTVNVKRTE